ncbi:hypothetical protein [Micromonospora coerulea]|uniref:hypothetical protein n=1 Tax=Micromonospora coerulea TaxID=47856 RepID=UPI001905CA15|nr:hypothetical protein [Micromonospora veneta]
MTDDDRAEREYARKLFGHDEPNQEPTDPPRSNYVPSEGSSPSTHPTGDEATRQWVRELFDYSGVPGW